MACGRISHVRGHLRETGPAMPAFVRRSVVVLLGRQRCLQRPIVTLASIVSEKSGLFLLTLKLQTLDSRSEPGRCH